MEQNFVGVQEEQQPWWTICTPPWLIVMKKLISVLFPKEYLCCSSKNILWTLHSLQSIAHEYKFYKTQLFRPLKRFKSARSRRSRTFSEHIDPLWTVQLLFSISTHTMRHSSAKRKNNGNILRTSHKKDNETVMPQARRTQLPFKWYLKQ